MGRNKKPRMVAHTPPVTVFKPAGVPARTLQWLRLTLDEYEALRLADYEGLSQEEAAERLGVSRPTVSRILEGARRTVATALVHGQALAIEGGPVRWRPGCGPGAARPGVGRNGGQRDARRKRTGRRQGRRTGPPGRLRAGPWRQLRLPELRRDGRPRARHAVRRAEVPNAARR